MAAWTVRGAERTDRPAPIGLIRYPPSLRHTEVATLAYHGGRASRPLAEASHEVRCRDEAIPPRLLAGFRSVERPGGRNCLAARRDREPRK